MTVTVSRINIPAWSTIGYGWGTDEMGNKVSFVGDHRPMRDIGEAMQHTTSDDPIIVELEDWQIQGGPRKEYQMLTSGQCQVAAYLTDGDVICPDCAAERLASPGGAKLQSLIQYDLDSDESWQEDGLFCGDCGQVLVEPIDESAFENAGSESDLDVETEQ